MFNTQTAPMVKSSNQVHTTTDYFLFKSIDGNRNKNLLHLNRLRKSMEENYLFTVIIVNENYEIIDGQHRFEIIQELGLPLNYIICKGYGLNEVHILNQNSKNWTAEDYLRGYCDLGMPEYLKFEKFCKRHNLKISVGMLILNNNTSKNQIDVFNRGELLVKDYQKGEKLAHLLKLIEPIYSGVKRQSFILAMIKLQKNPKFEFVEFLSKLTLQPASLRDCVNVEQYIAIIEEIYNYRRREKINLRY